jgi:hypothetical protein
MRSTGTSNEGRIATCLGAVGEGDLQHLGQQVQRVHRAEAQALDVVAFEDVQHLGDVHARCGGRRRADDLPIAIAAADRRALDHAVVGEVLFGDEAAGFLHALDQQVAQRTAMKCALALLGDQGQSLAIVGLHEARAGFQRRAIGQQSRGCQLVLHKVGGRALDAVGQVRRHREAAGGMTDRGLHDVGERHRAVAPQGQGPGQQRARHGNRLRADLILAALDVVDLRRGAGHRPVHVRAASQRHRAHAVDDGVGAVGETDVTGRAADQADHHRLGDGERELRGDGGVDGIAAGRQHLHPGGGTQRMVGHHHALGAVRRLLFAGEERAGALPPVRSAHVSRSFP